MSAGRRIAVSLGLLLGLATAPALAQEARYYREGRHLVHELAGTIPATPRIRVAADLGAVEVEGAPGNEVRYRIRVRVAARDDSEARRLLDGLLVSASRRGDELLFQGLATRPDTGRGLSAEFHLTVPAATRHLEVATGAGDVRARGLLGTCSLMTRGGTIGADDLGGSLRAETRGGSIEVGRVGGEAGLSTAGGGVRLAAAGGGVTAQTSGGDVVLGRAGGDVRAQTGGGNILIDEAAGSVVVETSGGNIEVGRAGGKVSAATAGGSIRVASARGGAHCETAAGPIDLGSVEGSIRAITSSGSIRAAVARGRAPFSDSSLEAWQGDVTIILPDSLPLTIRALVDNPAGHPIRSDFPLTITRDTEVAGRPVEIAEGSIGGGGSLLKVRTLGGSIVILKAKNANP